MPAFRQDKLADHVTKDFCLACVFVPVWQYILEYCDLINRGGIESPYEFESGWGVDEVSPLTKFTDKTVDVALKPASSNKINSWFSQRAGRLLLVFILDHFCSLDSMGETL